MIFAVVPQVQAQTDETRRQQELMQQQQQRAEQLTQEMNQLQADFLAGRITLAQFQSRVALLQNEIANMNTQAQVARQQAEQSGASFSQAQLQRIETLLDQDKSLEAQNNERRITEADYTRQATAVRNELNQITAPFKGSPSAAIQYAEVEERIKKLWPGTIAGWPPTVGAFPRDSEDRSYLEVGDLNHPLRQGANTRASYYPRARIGGIFGFIASYRIFQTGANQATLEDLRRQIESATGKTMQRVTRTSGDGGVTYQEANGYYLEFIDSRTNTNTSGLRYWSTHSIFLEDGTLEYQVSDSSFDYGPSTTKSDEE